MIYKGDTLIITKVYNNNCYNEKIKDKLLGSVIVASKDMHEDGLFLGYLPEYSNFSQCFNIKDFDYKFIKDKKRNMIKDLYEKAKVGGFAHASK